LENEAPKLLSEAAPEEEPVEVPVVQEEEGANEVIPEVNEVAEVLVIEEVAVLDDKKAEDAVEITASAEEEKAE
jgi:hypothetical protein